MKTISVVTLVLCFGIAFTMIAGSGVGASVFGESGTDTGNAETLEQIGEEAQPDADREDSAFSSDVRGDNEPTLVGFAISGGQFIVQLVASVALLPATLMRLGFPNYFAVPVGLAAQTVAAVGLFQFVTGRVYE